MALAQGLEADVHAPLGDQGLLAADAQLLGHDHHVGVLPVEFRIYGGEHGAAPAGGKAYGEGALLHGGHISQDAVGLLFDLEHLFRIL